ncbi:hypothetical protein LAZ67_8000730 [Cordylochernes scorpioides]|uniref:Uncharacterized protein n=1 Tax=Cordylochernes scorpioides TaxID=51811 RepID=A0ABY6KQ50_9ARAC|nr:hypothetical protein LAZ67_8000730 [Cordylochernes scorpioides]
MCDRGVDRLAKFYTGAVAVSIFRPCWKKSADTELKTMIVQMSSEIRNLGERIDTRLSNIEKRIIEWDQRLLGVELKLTTCVETSAATNEKVSENVTKLREIEARTDFLEMKLREPNLVFYGVEGEANEGPAERGQLLGDELLTKRQERVATGHASDLKAVVGCCAAWKLSQSIGGGVFLEIPNMLKILIGPWTTLEQDLTDWNKTLKFPRHLHLGDLPDLDALLAGFLQL